VERRTVFVTGATGGLGQGLVKALAGPRTHFILLGRSVAALEAVDDAVQSRGGTATLVPVDLARPEQLQTLAGALLERFSKIDLFLSCAAMTGPMMAVQDIPPQVWEDVFQVNLYANWQLLRMLTPFLQDGGRIVFFTSEELLGAYDGLYGASKSALRALVERYQRENTQIQVDLVDPGAMATKLRTTVFPGVDPATWPDPDKVANILVERLELL